MLKLLQRSLDQSVPVQIVRTVAPNETLHGIVLDLTRDWVLLTGIRDGGYFDGYNIVRPTDFRSVETDTRFLPFLREHQAWPPAQPAEPIDLSSPSNFISAAASLAGVVTLFEEARRPDMCWIGSPADWGKKSVWILTIDPDATWDDYMTQFKFKHLTRIDFADDYNKALVTVAGPKPPPTAEHGQPG
ncbi:hypothetical protein ACX8Z9_14405 [Arthrobacter halodurans]|uniref:Immunity protein 26 n=1 Tax=Arthrobacter halodurans TaxID=516699 RepID=A0ABV4UMV8_9MICC